MRTVWMVVIPLVIGSLPTMAASDDQGWHPGQVYLAVQAGWGEGFSLGFSGNGDTRQVEYVAILPHIGFDVSGWVGEDSWYQGNLDLLLEAEYLSAQEPKKGDFTGGAVLLRYHFRALPRWTPYFEAGFGLGDLDFDLRDQADGLVFTPQFGAGVNFFLSKRLSLNAGWRYHHLSNAGREQPNNGINANVFLLGFGYALN